MSATAYWTPTPKPKPQEGTEIPIGLRRVLEKRGCGEHCGEMTLNESDISYLEGIRDANIKGAQCLIWAIEEHKSIDLTWCH